jgi:hypothetical protein
MPIDRLGRGERGYNKAPIAVVPCHLGFADAVDFIAPAF